MPHLTVVETYMAKVSGHAMDELSIRARELALAIPVTFPEDRVRAVAGEIIKLLV